MSPSPTFLKGPEVLLIDERSIIPLRTVQDLHDSIPRRTETLKLSNLRDSLYYIRLV